VQDPPKFTQIWIFGLKTNHLATLVHRRKVSAQSPFKHLHFDSKYHEEEVGRRTRTATTTTGSTATTATTTGSTATTTAKTTGSTATTTTTKNGTSLL
jgi:hypothetical protein